MPVKGTLGLCFPLVLLGKQQGQWPLKANNFTMWNYTILFMNRKCLPSSTHSRNGSQTYWAHISPSILTTRCYRTLIFRKNSLKNRPDGWNTCHNMTVPSSTSMGMTTAWQMPCHACQTQWTMTVSQSQVSLKFDLTLPLYRTSKTGTMQIHGVEHLCLILHEVSLTAN